MSDTVETRRDMAENWWSPDLLGQRVDFGAWKGRASELARRWASQSRLRFTARREALLLVAVILFLLFVFGDLKLVAALMAGLVAVAAAAITPCEDASNSRVLTAGGSVAEHPSTMGAPKSEGWRALIDAMPDAAIALAADGSVLHFNGLFRDLFPRCMSGIPFSHVTRNPELMAAVDQALAMSEPAVVELTERVPLERRLSATVSGQLAGAGGAGQPALLITLRDQTEQDRLAQMRADFIANASHELRTPLAALRGFVETLQGPAREDVKARERFLGLMQAQATRMTRLIDDLLSLSRVEMRAHLSPRGTADLGEIASHVTQTVEPLAKEANIAIALEISVPCARIRGERDEIVQALLNLVQNAIKSGRAGGHVSVRVAHLPARGLAGQQVEIAVIDDGPGIAPEHLPRLTERFYRVNAGKSRDKGGTGLGLAIVKHIVVRHRGELRIASEVGKGSTFALVFDGI